MIPDGRDGRVSVPPAPRLQPERRALNRLADAGLLRRVDVAVKQRGGRRGPRQWLYFLDERRRGEAIATAGRLCGVSDAKKAKDGYLRGGLKGRHTYLRNDYLIRLMFDARAARARGEGVEVPPDDTFGESHPDFPLLGARVERDEAGRELDRWERRKAGYETIEPDGRFRIDWPERGLGCPFDVELELGTRPEIVGQKVEARAAMFARLHREAEEREKREWGREVGEVVSDPNWMSDDGKAERQELLSRTIEHHGKGPVPYFCGLPGGVVPVVFLFETRRRAANMRSRLLDDEIETPRYDALNTRLAPHGLDVGRLFLFSSLEDLLPSGVEGPGRTLESAYAPLSTDTASHSLRDVAEALDRWRGSRREAYLMREARAGKSV